MLKNGVIKRKKKNILWITVQSDIIMYYINTLLLLMR